MLRGSFGPRFRLAPVAVADVADRLCERVLEKHARNLDGLLQREEEAGPCATPTRHADELEPVETDGALRDGRTRTAHQRVGQGALPRAVRPHHHVHFAASDGEVDTPHHLVAGGRRVEAFDFEHVSRIPGARAAACHGSTTATSSPVTSTSYTGTGFVAGREQGFPVSSSKVLPCLGHSISRSSVQTSPSASE